MMRSLSLLLPLVAALPAQQASSALDDYRGGRHRAAFDVFQAELLAGGERAPLELRWNTALAALRLQRPADAEAAITPLLAHAQPAVVADAEFVLAMCRHQRGERAAAAAQLPDAEPMAWTMALRALQQAIDGFLRAANRPGGWPEAVRNGERCQRRLQELERLRAQQEASKPKQEQVPQRPPEAPKPAQPPEPEATAPAPVLDRLSPAELAALLQRGLQRDRKKRQERQAAAVNQAVAGERDW